MNTGTWVVKISDAGTARAAHFIAAFRPTEPYDVIECCALNTYAVHVREARDTDQRCRRCERSLKRRS